MALFEDKTMRLLFPLHILSIILLIMYVLSLGLFIALVPVLAVEIATLWFARSSHRWFFFLWQFPFFIVLLVGILTEPVEVFQKYDGLPSLAQPLSIAVLIVFELVVAAISHYGERLVKSVLMSATLIMIVSVLAIILLIGSEGLPGFLENDPGKMLTSTNWYIDYVPDQTYSIDVPTKIIQYDYDVSTNNSNMYVGPGNNRFAYVTVTNMGSLIDTYDISISSGSGIAAELNTPEMSIPSTGQGVASINVTGCEIGSYDLVVTVKSVHSQISKAVKISVNVSDTGIDFGTDDIDYYANGPAEASMGSIPFNITNAGICGSNVTLRVTADSKFIPSISEATDWSSLTHEGTVYLEPGETRQLTLVQRFVQLVDGDYTLHVEALTNGTVVSDSFDVHFSFKYAGVGRAQNDWSMPLYPGNETAWNIDIDLYGYSNAFVKLADVPQGYSCRLFYNGMELKSPSDWSNITLNNGLATVTMVVTTDHQDVGELSNIIVEVNTQGIEQAFGMAAFIFGSAITVCLSIIMAVPLALGSAIYLAEYSSNRVRRFMKPVLELLAGIPSVVYGLWGGLVLGPLLATSLYPAIASTLGTIIPFFGGEPILGRSIMTATIVLAIMIFPIIMTLSYDAIAVVPSELKDASLATGASKWQTVRRVVLVKAKSGIFASVILGMGRALGETMAVLMVMGSISKIPVNVFDSVGTMPAVIASQFDMTSVSITARHGLFAVALLLFVLVFILNIVMLTVSRENKAGNPVGKAYHKLRKRMAKILPSRSDSIIDSREVHMSFRNGKYQHRFDQSIRYVLLACAAILMLIICYILGDILIRGGSAMSLSQLTTPEKLGGGGGFMNAILGSISLVAIAILVAAPISIMAAVYINEYADKNSKIVKMATIATTTLASTPSIIFGVFGFTLFVLYLGFGFSMIAGGLTLAMMVIPLIFVSTSEGLKSVPANIREASLALGVSNWKTISHVILPVAFPSISTGVIISMGRSIGETAAILLTAGYTVTVANSLFGAAASMPNMIYRYYEISSQMPDLLGKLYAASLVLIIVVLVLNIAARLVAHLSQKRMGIKADRL